MNWKIGVSVAALLFAITAFAAKLTTPIGMDHLEPYLSEEGWKPAQLRLLEGGYSSGFLSQAVYGRYHSLDPVRPGQLQMRLERPTPIHAWRPELSFKEG